MLLHNVVHFLYYCIHKESHENITKCNEYIFAPLNSVVSKFPANVTHRQTDDRQTVSYCSGVNFMYVYKVFFFKIDRELMEKSAKNFRFALS